MEAYIKESHNRCKSTEILTSNLFSTKILNEVEITDILLENKELILNATPFMNLLYDFVSGTGFLAILCDRNGCILNVIGDEVILPRAVESKMIVGAYMDEFHIGTNAMSLVISEKIPIQISGKEHFIKDYQKWTCSAAPIKDLVGNIIGIIDLTGYMKNAHPHTLGMVVAAADAIGEKLEINKYNSMLEISKKRLETSINAITSGILTCDLSGNITTMNKQVARMFGYKENEIMKIKIYDLIQNWNGIMEHLKVKGTFINEDIYINSRINKLQYTLTLYPIYDIENNIEEVTLVIQELKKGKKLGGKISSGQATYTFEKIVGKNERFIETIDYAKKISESKSTVLITGESGTGKEVFAQSIHNYGTRRDEPFIAVNCGAIPRSLVESELFGYEEGAFTGAKKGGNAGKFEIADGGTIFLDEIGEMPTDMQIKILRVIGESAITRIGSSKQIPIDVRIMAATNKDLLHEIEIGKFRSDLYYRLNVMPIYLLPLRQRRDDIPELVNYYMKKTSKMLNKKAVDIPEEYMKYLMAYDWPGNVRELENLVELIINSESIKFNFNNKVDEVQNNTVNLNFNISLEMVEKQHIIEVLREVKGNMTIAANILEIGRNTLYRKIQKFEIDCSKNQ
ncbi:MAG TPA: sigma 54-interacting transcriptional regulator [Clostridium sp.]|uniref:sigma-54-dependent Fis family transcriptional regulator n=1 Tax=Clostridium sp. TaxID=1506 RepID=UPI002F950329